MKKWELPWRTFLRGMGTMIALPVLDAMIPSIARAQASNPMRVAFYYWPNGLPLPNHNNDRNLYTGMSNAFSSVKSDITLLYGVKNKAHETQGYRPGYDSDCHGAPQVVLMSAEAPEVNGTQNVRMKKTVDQVIAQEIFSSWKYPYLGVNVDPKGNGETANVQHARVYSECLYWPSPTTPAKLYTNPGELFTAMFGAGAPQPNTTPTPSQPMVDQKAVKKKSILDFVIGDIKSMNNTLGARDKERLDEYLTSLEKIERDIATLPTATPPPTPGGPVCSPGSNPGNMALDKATYVKRLGVMQDLMVKAFQCDITRVFDFMAATEFGWTDYVSGSEPGYLWHDYSHGEGSGFTMHAKVVEFHFARMVELMNKFKAVKNPDGTNLLDSSLIVFHSLFADGLTHSSQNLHFGFAGKAGGRFKTGQNLNLSSADIGDVWLTIMKEFGVKQNTYGEVGKTILNQLKA